MAPSRTEQTRARLQAAALDLFTRQGFDETTVAEVAAAAGVSHMTFFRHFPTKEAVLLEDPYDPVVGEAVRAQPRDLPALERTRRALLAAWAALPEPADADTRARITLVAGHPGLRAKAWESNLATEDVIADALTETGADPFEARVAAAACLAALFVALLDWAQPGGEASLTERMTTALELLGGRA